MYISHAHAGVAPCAFTQKLKRVLASKQVVRTLTPASIQRAGLGHDAKTRKKGSSSEKDSCEVNGERERGDEGASGGVLRGLASAGPGFGRGCCGGWRHLVRVPPIRGDAESAGVGLAAVPLHHSHLHGGGELRAPRAAGPGNERQPRDPRAW